MKEETVFIQGEDCVLEGLYAGEGNHGGALISHPHPLMGGAMHNSVVRTIANSLASRKISTLRFNFRGVGKSTGHFDDGRDEQADVLAAASFLEKNITSRPLLTGYSFGAWVNSMVVARSNEWKAILIAPPLAIYDFGVKALAGKIELIIAAQYDQFCSGEKVREMSKQLGCTLEIIPGADHFFSRQEDLLSQVLADFFIGTKRCHS